MNASIFDEPACYRISVWGTLDQAWSARLGGMTITQAVTKRGTPITVLRGELADQAAVSGLLQSLYVLGFTLLTVKREVEE